MLFIHLIEVVLLVYFTYVALYNLLLAIAGNFSIGLRQPLNRIYNRIAVLIPSYKEDRVISQSATIALRQNYPTDRFSIVVIADQLQPDTLLHLKSMPLKVVEVSLEKSTKVNSLNQAMEQIGDDYDIGIVLDADNVMEADFLEKINNCFNAGYLSIQGQRLPANNNTSMALLDGLSEDINNHIVRKGTCVWGGSSAIVGSGFGVKYQLLKSTLAAMNSVGGFDKELEIKLLEGGVKTIYLENARLYDEKVEKNEVFITQRKRWISSQYFYLKKYFNTGIRALIKGNLALFNSTVLRYIQLPRLLNIGVLFVLALLSFCFRSFLLFSFPVWPLLFILLAGSVLISVPRQFFSKRMLKALMKLPKVFLMMFLLLFKLKGANRNFIHTPHGLESKKR